MSESLDSSTQFSTAMSDLLYTGNTTFDPAHVRYVCHTATIPLPTTVDEQYLLYNSKNVVEVTHSTKYLDEEIKDLFPYRCCKIHCMMTSRNRNDKSYPELLRHNCPCGEIIHQEYFGDVEYEASLQPLCFLQVIKELRYNFGYIDASMCESDDECCHNDSLNNGRHTTRPRINFDEVMFCQNSQSILDSRYSSPMREKVLVTGWENVRTTEQLKEALNCLYWFRKAKDHKLWRFIESEWQASAARTKRAITQTLHTLTGLTIKKLLLFPVEMENYHALATKTAKLFHELVTDYLRPNNWGETHDLQSSVFVRIKDTMKLVKERFAGATFQLRTSVFEEMLDEENRSDHFKRFFATCFVRLRKRVATEAEVDKDYSQGLAWIFTMSGFSQTRNLGYLPEWVAVIKREQYRRTICRPTENVTQTRLRVIAVAIQKRCADMGIPPRFMEIRRPEVNQIYQDCISAIKIPLKITASENTVVSKGGKLEDARQILNLAIEHEWKVPVYDLEEGHILSYIQCDESLRGDKPPYDSYLFWISFTIMLDYMEAQKGNKRVTLAGSESWLNRLMNMEIVHISEPGKERNLTKASSLVAWFLTPCSKVSQMAMSYNQDHKAGLVLSAQDWMHQRRVASESFESHWMYDKETRYRKDDVWNGYQDWTESTDFIPRRVGGIALKAWLEYIGFPKFYRELILRQSQYSYRVTEVAIVRDPADPEIRKIEFNGLVSEGFMMGNPLTKSILHLMHDVHIGVISILLRDLGVTIPTFSDTLKEDPLPKVSVEGTLRMNIPSVASSL